MTVYTIQSDDGKTTTDVEVFGRGCFVESRIIANGGKIIAIDGVLVNSNF